MLAPIASVRSSYVQLATKVSICGTHPTASESYTVLPSAVMVIVVTDPAVRALYDHIGRSEPKLPKNSTYSISGHGWNMQSVSGGIAIIKALDFNRHTLSFPVLNATASVTVLREHSYDKRGWDAAAISKMARDT